MLATKRLLIIYHSHTGGSAQMAEAAYQGACTEVGITTCLQKASDTVPADVLLADGLVFVCPENLAAISGVMKDFFDRCYYPVLGQLAGRPYATMVCAGSDGHNATRQIARIATGWRLQAVTAQPLIVCTHAQTPEAIAAPKRIPADDLARCAELGQSMAAGLALGIF